MAFPTKGRRTISIKSMTFHWRVVGIDEPEFGFAVWTPEEPDTSFLRVCIGNPSAVVTPSMVARAIEDELLSRSGNPQTDAR